MDGFNLSVLFQEVFGYKSKAFEPDLKRVPQRAEYGKAASSPYYAVDNAGVEYFLPVELIVPSDIAATVGISNGDGSTANRWMLPYPVLSFSLNKRFIETELTERRGTVKELINTGDYRISIKGFLIGKGNDFPEDDFTTLTRIVELGVAVKINNPITDIILLRPGRAGSDEVVISSLRFPPVIGVQNVRAYELELMSDEPFNLIDIS